MTTIFLLETLKSIAISFFELNDGVEIALSFGATFFCIFKNENHRHFEIFWIIPLENSRSYL